MFKHYNFVLKEDEEDWQGEEFCVKVLCEHEEVIIHVTSGCKYWRQARNVVIYM